MIRWLLASPADRRVLGTTRWRGPTPWVIAMMSFSIVIVAAAGLAVAGTAGLIAKSAERRYSVQVPAGGSDLAALLQTVRSAPGVVSAEAVPEAEMRKTLERWLGPTAGNADLPVPALINFDLRPGGNPAAVAARVRTANPAATVSGQAGALRPLLRSLRALQWLALGLVLLLSAAAAAAVVLAARGAFDTHRTTIQVMHGIGATDLQITHLFQRKIALDAFTGSMVGGLAAAIALSLLLTGATFAGELTGGAALGLGDALLLALLPIALTLIATGAGRMAVLAALRQSL
jgi:cell division transport system permease protein